MAQALSQDARFDFIIVGGHRRLYSGRRLTRSGRSKVLLVEAGGESALATDRFRRGSASFWSTRATTGAFWAPREAAADFRRIAIPRGKGLWRLDADQRHDLCPRPAAGTTVAGPRRYEELGLARRAAAFQDHRDMDTADPDDLRGHDGPLPINEVIEKSPIGRPSSPRPRRRASANPDYNGRAQGRRRLVSGEPVEGRARLGRAGWLTSPARGREPNLTVLTDARVTRILLDGAQAKGVALTHIAARASTSPRPR